MKKTNLNAKLAGASAMLLLSASMLGTSTYAWFTMNKEVSVTGMEVKAHAEEGLLINEVAAHDSDTWDEQATGNTTATLISLRPASTADFTKFWHANSTKSYDEAGIGDDQANTALISEGVYYKEVTAGATNISDKVFVAAADAETAGENGKATGNSKAETHVYYDQATFGDSARTAYDDGEGYYVKYTYYLKSSSSAALSVKNLQVAVKATKKTTDPAGDSDNLDAALRVGVAYGNVTKIFAPVTGADATYSVTSNAAGSASTSVSAVIGTTGNFTAYTTMNTATDGTANLSIPAVASDGNPLYVYVWFEGEDDACMSDNLSAALATYDIDIKIKDADLD
jgi:hypothetical protein